MDEKRDLKTYAPNVIEELKNLLTSEIVTVIKLFFNLANPIQNKNSFKIHCIHFNVNFNLCQF